MPASLRKFKDLDLNFSVHPNTKDLVFLKDENAIKRALTNLLFTNYNERYNDPDFGVGLRNMLFEPMSYFTAFTIQEMIQDAITFFEPRINLQYLQVDPDEDNNGYNIKLIFTIDNVLNPITIDYFLERTR